MTRAPWRRWHVTFTRYRTDGWHARSGGQRTPFPWWELQVPLGTFVLSHDRTLFGWSPPVTPPDGRPEAMTTEPRWHTPERLHAVNEDDECVEDCPGCHWEGNLECEALPWGCDICDPDDDLHVHDWLRDRSADKPCSCGAKMPEAPF